MIIKEDIDLVMSKILHNVESVVGIALMNIADRSEAYDTIAKMLGTNRNTAKKLCYMYGYRAGNTALRKVLIEEDQIEGTTATIIHNASGSTLRSFDNAKVTRTNTTITVKSGSESFTGSVQEYCVIVHKTNPSAKLHTP